MDTNINFHVVNLQVEKVLGECPCTTKPNACHYYVDIERQFDEMQKINCIHVPNDEQSTIINWCNTDINDNRWNAHGIHVKKLNAPPQPH